MPLAPRAVDIPRIPGALKFYRVMSYITGTFLLLLVAEMILKYCIDARDWSLVVPGGMTDAATGDFVFLEPGFEIEAFGPHGFLALVPSDTVTAVNIWSMMRWSFGKLLIIALGGIVPGLSFVVEHFYAKQVVEFLDTQDSSATPVKGEAA
jgi:hypothetical protein